MTFDLDLDLEQTLGAGPAVDDCVQVWWRYPGIEIGTTAIGWRCTPPKSLMDARMCPP